ncbi:MAG: hypothetical protein RSA10_01625 [Bacilli bacterium]
MDEKINLYFKKKLLPYMKSKQTEEENVEFLERIIDSINSDCLLTCLSELDFILNEIEKGTNFKDLDRHLISINLKDRALGNFLLETVKEFNLKAKIYYECYYMRKDGYETLAENLSNYYSDDDNSVTINDVKQAVKELFLA